MTCRNLGILHPGSMGSALARAALANGVSGFWASANRSQATAERARKAGLEDLGDIAELCTHCDTMLAICPPHAALETAKSVAAAGFSGNYVDANAIAPQTARQIADIITATGGTYTDAALVGAPPQPGFTTYLILAGANTTCVRELFDCGYLRFTVLGGEPYLASALKMSHSLLKKGSFALTCMALALAGKSDLFDEFVALWRNQEQELSLVSDLAACRRQVGKAWRLEGEMLELEKAFAGSEVPAELFRHVAELFHTVAENEAKLPRDLPDDEFFTALLEEIDLPL